MGTTESVRKDKSNREVEQRQFLDWRAKTFLQTLYAQLYEHSAGTNIVLTTADTYYQWVSSSAGLSSGVPFVTLNTTTDKIIIGSSGAGVWQLFANCCVSVNAAAAIHMGVFINDVLQENVVIHIDLSSANLHIAMSCQGFAELEEGDEITLKFASDTNSRTITVESVQLSAVRISG